MIYVYMAMGHDGLRLPSAFVVVTAGNNSKCIEVVDGSIGSIEVIGSVGFEDLCQRGAWPAPP